MSSLIERQAAIDALGEEPLVWHEDDAGEVEERNQWRRDVAAIKALPSAHPSAEWIERTVSDDAVIEEWQSAKCSACGRYHTTPYMYYFDNYNYCPHCGARMRGDHHE